MTFTKCKAEPRYHLVPYFGNPNPQTWAATYTEPITFEFCTQHYIISLGNPPQFKPISSNWANFLLHEIAKIYWNKSKFEYIELIRKKILKKLLKNLTRLTIPDIKLLKKKFRRKKRWGNLKNQNADMFSKGIYNFFFTKKKEARWRDFEKTRHAHLFSNKGKLLLSRYTRSLVPMFDKR